MTDRIETDLGLPTDRVRLRAVTEQVLHRGGWGNPDVLLVRTNREPVVVKDFSPRSKFVRFLIGRWLLRREAAAYRCLEGVSAIPRLLGNLDQDALVFEYRPGVLLSRSLSGRLPSDFMPNLEAAVLAIHGRGVVHLDLRHRSNILADEAGKPVVLDFASSLRFDCSTRAGRWATRLLGQIDRHALEKWRVRVV